MIVIAPAPTGEPGKAPASYAIQISAATSLPSLVAPILHRIVLPEVGPVARNTSPRVITKRTGWPVFFDSNRAKRFEINHQLAAEAAADFGRHHLDVAFRHVENLRPSASAH